MGEDWVVGWVGSCLRRNDGEGCAGSCAGMTEGERGNEGEGARGCGGGVPG